jgi:Flp pilus assembly protein TadG
MTFALAMRAVRAQFDRFQRAKRGAIAILFALAVLPLLFLIGLAVDFRTLQTARSDMQNALDSGLLAAARVYNANAGLSETARQNLATTAGTAMFKSNLTDSGPPLTEQQVDFTFDKNENRVTATGYSNCKTAFGGLLHVFGGEDIDHVRLRVYGEAQGSDPRRLEIVLSLDNTGSMFDTGGSGAGRFNLMRSAAKNFVNTMFDNQSLPNKMYIGVIPWTTTVNINMERPIAAFEPAAYSAPEVGFDGTRTTPPAAFQDFRQYLKFPLNHTLLTGDTANPTWAALGGVNVNPANATHLAAFNAMFAPVSWRGCIRGATGEVAVSSGGVVTSTITDAPPALMRWTVDAVEPILRTWTSGSNSGRLRCGTGSNSQDDGTYNAYMDKVRPCRTTSSTTTNSNSVACVSDAYEFAWLASNAQCSYRIVTIPRTSLTQMFGPNVNCVTPMQGLSGSREQTLKTLNRMYPGSDGTQQEVGLLWGLRMLSPRATWVSFFGHNGNNTPTAYNTNDTRKILILLTDGDNNAATKWEGYWGCTQTGTRNSGSGRAADVPVLPAGAGACNTGAPEIAGTLNDTKLDALTLATCDAIRNTYHIELYTIGVDIGAGAAATLLRNCAGDAEHAKIISAAQLDETFLAIANDSLRITK